MPMYILVPIYYVIINLSIYSIGINISTSFLFLLHYHLHCLNLCFICFECFSHLIFITEEGCSIAGASRAKPEISLLSSSMTFRLQCHPSVAYHRLPSLSQHIKERVNFQACGLLQFHASISRVASSEDKDTKRRYC